jgi:hypothetical protein
MDIPGLQNRVASIIKRPAHAWAAIAAEPEDIGSLYLSYIMPLAAIPAISLFLGLSIIGAPIVGRYGISTALSAAVAVFVSTLVAPIVAAVVIEQLAPKFKSRGDTVQALKLVAYASTPVWVAGVLYLIVMLSPLMIVAILYAIYLFFLGLPVMMKTPEDQVIPFMVVSALVVVVVSIVLRFIESSLGLPMYGF